MKKGMITCAVDFETGGLQPYFHEALSVAIVPLNEDFTPNEELKPFISDIGVDHIDRLHPRALAVNGKTKEQVEAVGPRKESVKAFFQWAAELSEITGCKTFSPLAQNWSFDKGFFMAWLDPTFAASDPDVISRYVDYRARDLARVAMYACDRAKLKGQPLPFPGTSLEKIAATLGVVNPAPHTAYGDAVTTALCYAKLVAM